MKLHIVYQAIALGICLLASSAISAAPKPSSERPNIIVIMADDLGYNDLGVYGCKDIPTPHIDSLAKEGVRFTSGYVTWPMCGPSRAGFLTGKHQSKFGFYSNVGAPFNPDQGLPKMDTIASLLQKEGYVTGGVGKWHMGTSNDQHPNSMGFDDWYGFLGGGLKYFPLDHPIYNGRFANMKKPMGHKQLQHTMPLIHNYKPVEWNQYLTRELTDAGLNFLDKYTSQKGSGQRKPFFLFMSYNAPHLDLEAPEETIAKFPEDKMTILPGVKPKARSIYGAMVYEMDEGIGKLLDKVDALGIAENTVIWFLSDHGGMKRTSDNRPLKGAKGASYEGGIRVPLLVKWPGKTPVGVVMDSAVTSLDIGATAIAMAGGDPVAAGLHGKDIRPYMTGQSAEAPHDVLYWHTGKSASENGVIREGDYKLIFKGNKREIELYNLKADLGETTNIASAHPDRVQSMVARLKEWNKDRKPNLWGQSEVIQYAEYEWLKGSMHYGPSDKGLGDHSAKKKRREKGE